MGGCLISLSGDTRAEVTRKLKDKLIEGRAFGLCEERRSQIIFNPKTKKFIACVALHT